MKSRKRTIFVLLLLFSAVLIGCDESTPDPTVISPTDVPATATSLPPSTPTLIPTDAPTSEPEPTAEPPPPTQSPTDVPTQEPTAVLEPTDAPTEASTLTPEPTEPAVSNNKGYACFGTDGYGLSCLTADGEWQVFDEGNSAVSAFVNDLALCPDGTMLVVGFDLLRYDGESLQEIDTDGEFFAPDAVTCGEDGTIWVGHFEGVSVWQDGVWTTYGVENINSDPDSAGLIADIGVDGNGHVWALSANSVAVFDGVDWTEYSEIKGNLGDNYFFSQLFFDSAGFPWVTGNSGLVQFDGNRWVEHKSPDFESLASAVVDANGNVLASTFDDGVLVFDGQGWSSLDTEDEARSIAVDQSGRLYVGTAYGVNIRDGGEWVAYDMDSADLPANTITSIAVLDDGPALPAQLDKTDGAILGRIVSAEGIPLAETNVQLCVRELYSVYFGETPCSDQARYFSILTNGDGDFLFEDVPVGIYYIVYFIEGDWVKLTDEFGFGSEEILVLEGKTVDVGVLTVTEE